MSDLLGANNPQRQAPSFLGRNNIANLPNKVHTGGETIAGLRFWAENGQVWWEQQQVNGGAPARSMTLAAVRGRMQVIRDWLTAGIDKAGNMIHRPTLNKAGAAFDALITRAKEQRGHMTSEQQKELNRLDPDPFDDPSPVPLSQRLILP